MKEKDDLCEGSEVEMSLKWAKYSRNPRVGNEHAWGEDSEGGSETDVGWGWVAGISYVR